MTDSATGHQDDAPGAPSSAGRTLARQLIEVAAMPVAMAIAAIVLALASLFAMAPASEIGQLDTSSKFGLPLPSGHEFEISSGIRLAVALFALALVAGAVRRLASGGARLARDDVKNWRAMITGAATIVAIVAVVLNIAAFADALLNAPLYSVYNHIGS